MDFRKMTEREIEQWYHGAFAEAFAENERTRPSRDKVEPGLFLHLRRASTTARVASPSVIRWLNSDIFTSIRSAPLPLFWFNYSTEGGFGQP